MISTSVSGSIGGFQTFLGIVLSFVAGVFILSNLKFNLRYDLIKVKNKELTQDEFIRGNIGKAIGALLLILPGFFTDIIGILLQFSFFVLICSKLFFSESNINKERKFTNDRYEDKHLNDKIHNKKNKDEDIIDVEIVDDN